jgi:hypothetical protein
MEYGLRSAACNIACKVSALHSDGALFHAIRGARVVRFSVLRSTKKMQADKKLFTDKHLKNTSSGLCKVARSVQITAGVA